MPNSGHTTIKGPTPRRRGEDEEGEELRLALVVIWAGEEPSRLGEALFPTSGSVFGRGPADDDGEPRVGFVRQRPEKNLKGAPCDNPFLSRRHLRFDVSLDAIEIQCVGHRPLRFADVEVQSATVREGDIVEITDLYAFLCVRRPAFLAAGGDELAPVTFGEADAYGIVGESAPAWTLRSQVSFLGKRNAHVLVTGSSGTGKELVAQAIHRLSSRAKKDIVSRNAATFPSGLIDAELFGNLANYPNVGMPERLGLIGQADGSTLFLDEIGELPSEMQAHLLRVLDGGEYQRLGDPKRRFADIRLVAATNRAPEELKEDLAARLALRVQVPGLDDRREDIALLARHILKRTAARDAEFAQRFCTNGEPRITSELVRALTQHSFATHVRELDGVLMRAAGSSSNRKGGEELDLTKEVRTVLRPVARPANREVGADEIRAALARHGGVKDKAWRDLGLASRHALHRLMKKLNIDD